MTEPDREQLRSQVFEILALIGDPEAQLRYERDVPIANVPAELVCMWFEDVFRPDELPDFPASFSKAEFAVLSAFSEFYDARVDALPTRSGVVGLHGSPVWTVVMERANETLKRVAPEMALAETWYPKE